MKVTTQEALEKLEEYVNLPSGSFDRADVNAFGMQVQQDFEALGMQVTRHDGGVVGDTLECTYGEGKHKILLMGHMDTVFPQEEAWPMYIEGDRAYGPGTMDMKGGLLVMYFALREVLPALPSEVKVVCLLNADEEIGSETSRELISRHAKTAVAALSFEPARPSGAFVGGRKGVISFTVTCKGQRGHSGSAYLHCASAIQQLCCVVNALYTLRDDTRDISINVGTIHGGVGENIIADEATAQVEMRYFNPNYKEELVARVREICAQPGIAGTTTTVEMGANHPPFMAGERSEHLLNVVKQIGQAQGRVITAERTGGAGDISFAALEGTAALDGLGLLGDGAHSKQEYAQIASFLPAIALAVETIQTIAKAPEQFE